MWLLRLIHTPLIHLQCCQFSLALVQVAADDREALFEDWLQQFAAWLLKINQQHN
jgi:hypothetical protein